MGKKHSKLTQSEKRKLRSKFIDGLKKRADISKAKFEEIQRKLAADRRRIIKKEWGVTDEAKIAHYARRVSHRRLIQKETEPKVRERFRLMKDGTWKERKTGKRWKEVNVRRSIAVKAYWKQVRFVAKVADISVSESRKIFGDIFIPGGAFPEVAGS